MKPYEEKNMLSKNEKKTKNKTAFSIGLYLSKKEIVFFPIQILFLKMLALLLPGNFSQMKFCGNPLHGKDAQ